MSPSVVKSFTAPVNTALETALQAAFDAGVQAGVEQERQRVRRALYPEAAAATQQTAPARSTIPSAGVMAAASFMNMARTMLAKDKKRTFGISDVTDYFREHYRIQIEPGQVRTILKVLTRQSEAERTERGIYRAGPKLVVQTSLLSEI